MGSEGAFAGGVDEVLDVRAAVGRARTAAEGPTVVCGWSFGAHVALRACLDDERVAGLALVGMPLTGADPTLPSLPDPERLRSYPRPVLLLAGGEDPYCPAPGLKELAEALPNIQINIVPGADHYFRRQEREAGGIVAAFAAEVAAGAEGQ
jgi:pimeloyl-ACP methyl ester carboxylesterase